MATQRIGVYQEPCSSRIIQKAQLTYKLYLLEKARNKLEEELRDFTNQAYEDAHGVLNSSIPNPRYKDVIKALDRKCNEIVKLSALLKNYKADYQSFDRVSFNYFQPLKAALSHQQLKVSLDTLRPLSQQDGGKTSDLVNTPLTPSSSCLKQEKEKAVSEDKNKEVSMHIPAAIIQSNVVSEGKSEVLLPSVQDSFSEKSQCKLRSQVIWGHGDDVQVLHQKQTSSQLLRFLKEKAKTKGSLKVTFLEQTKSKYKANNSGSLLRTSPTVKTKSYQFRHVVTDDSVEERGPKMLHANINHAPVFQVKRVHSCGPLIYSCVIATETELWDIGDIFTEVLLEESVHSTALDTEKWQQAFAQVEDSSISIELKPQTLQHMQPRLKKNDSNYSGRLAANIVNIPEFEIRKFEETEVVVSHVVSPSHFYIQHADSHRKLEALFTDLKVSHLYAEQNCIPDIGSQVIYWSPQNEQWFRAQVAGISGVSSNRTGKTSSINVQVNRLDYGDSSCVSLCNIKQLSSEMAVLPLQALQVSMAHVMPINGTDWTEEAVGWFKAMVHDRTLYARMYPQGPTVTVELFLEKGKLGAMRRGASLSLRLAQNGHARHSKVKNSCLLKKSAIQLKMKEQEIEWEKYLISCYSQNKK
ncbi:uncharacterized protein LOC102231031 isoform X1 [Xiphophorus maculatus]|uniref:uncharacterized protein LOC102231031 isoform X1 n=1 Tax=Xiphophorus maculatus TaxID=8083 RepID=UPI000C6E4E1D|nr:uncharacterized protein LOC102231031 isoform X1 [Xiphophorus maculatus]